MRSYVILGFQCLLLVFALFARAQAAGGFQLVLDPDLTLDSSEKWALQQFLANAEEALPPSMKDAIGVPIVVRFTKFDSQSAIELPSCFNVEKTRSEFVRLLEHPTLRRKRDADGGTDQAMGRTPRFALPWARREIELNRNFLPEIYAGPERSRSYPCGHHTLYGLALATVLHELSHIYDYLNVPAKQDPAERAKRDECLLYTDIQDEDCKTLRTINTSVSDRPRFKNLMNLDKGFFIQNAKNQIWARSPDPYEFTNPAESFAVNMEYFLLDPEYRCRRPQVHEYFAKLFGYEPPGAGACRVSPLARMSTTLLPVSIDPDRIYEIHYLVADSGSSLASKFGHAMFRIVVCAPDRAQVGPDCLKDIGYHIVVSFRANVSGITTSYWSGLTGGYPSQLFLSSMPDIVSEYTIGQNRSLKSVPIRLTREEIRDFVYRTLEEYWDYQGKYYFFTNNCGTESFDFLKGVLGERSIQGAYEGIVTPRGLYDELASKGFLDESVLNSSQPEGRYYFPPFETLIHGAVAHQLLDPGAPSGETEQKFIDDYINKDTPTIRRSLYLSMKRSDSQDALKLAADFYSLEILVRMNLQAKSDRQMSNLLEAPDSKFGPEIRTTLQTIAIDRASLLPWFTAKSGYGIPLADEYLDSESLQRTYLEMINLTRGLPAILRQVEPEQFSSLDQVTENLSYFTAEMKSALSSNSGIRGMIQGFFN